MPTNTIYMARAEDGSIAIRQDEGSRAVYTSFPGIDEAAAAPDVRAASRIRLLGGRGSVDIVLRLGRAPGRRVELVSPVLLPSSRARRSAIAVLDALPAAADVLPASSCGGPGVVTDPVHAAYVLAGRVQDAAAGDAIAALGQHPAWPAMRFVHAINADALARLLAEIVDPRYYIPPRKPDQNRLAAYLGLQNEYVGPALGRPTPVGCDARVGGKIRLARLVMDCWRHDGVSGDPLEPMRFVWRAYFRATRLGEVAAARVASELFVKYLVATWTAAIYPAATDRLFVPSLFFDDPATAEACAEHMRQHAVQG